MMNLPVWIKIMHKNFLCARVFPSFFLYVLLGFLSSNGAVMVKFPPLNVYGVTNTIEEHWIVREGEFPPTLRCPLEIILPVQQRWDFVPVGGPISICFPPVFCPMYS